MLTWRHVLADSIPADLGREIDIFETQIELKRQGKIDDKIFAETRLRRGAYGQRYDSGQRDDGTGPKVLRYEDGTSTKGPDTLWHAPGMQRIKIPFGELSGDQLEVLADVAEEYADGICHVTTRQDIQLHYVHIEDTPDLMRRLAAVGITTREACGNTVRNVTGCPLAGVCRQELFDVTPYARAMSRFLLGHPDTQDFGRKFKVAFSGCSENACALVSIHDLGFIAKTRITQDGQEERGFETYVGGGLGTVPYQAKLYDEFVPESEILPLAQAISRVFARLGEKRNRARARAKFLVAKLGIPEFRRLVEEEIRTLAPDPRWTAFLPGTRAVGSAPAVPELLGPEAQPGESFERWTATNVYQQSQPGYVVATVTLPLGDATAEQTRRLADIARRFCAGNVRASVEQNLLLRWVRGSDLQALHHELAMIGLGEPGAGSIVDVTACPGTDTCKLGIASSRGLAGELRERLSVQSVHWDQAIRDLRIKISGCFNSCGQHHLADIGFYGVSRNVGGRTVPHFQVVLGGCWARNGSAYGLAFGAVPSKRIPEVIDLLTSLYVSERRPEENFQDFCSRIGKKNLKDLLSGLMPVPAYEQDSAFYSDWRDPREFSIGDLGVGECAGEVVSSVDFSLAEAERRAFEAQLLLDDGNIRAADEMAYSAMLEGARALVRLQFPDVQDDPETLVKEFRERFYDTQLFFDQYAGGKFAQYFLRRHEDRHSERGDEATRRLIEEASLFIEAAHACEMKLIQRPSVPSISVAAKDSEARAD